MNLHAPHAYEHCSYMFLTCASAITATGFAIAPDYSQYSNFMGAVEEKSGWVAFSFP